MNQKQMEAALKSLNYEMRKMVWRNEEFHPTPEQIDAGLNSEDYRDRANVWKCRNWKPKERHIQITLKDDHYYPNKKLWARKDWEPTVEQYETGLAHPDETVRQYVAHRLVKTGNLLDHYPLIVKGLNGDLAANPSDFDHFAKQFRVIQKALSPSVIKYEMGE